MNERVITVFGSGTARAGEASYEQARELGRAVAEAGWTLCNGGYGGTMEAGARGAREAGGRVIGVSCRLFGGRGGVNAYVTQEVPTFELLQRLNTLMRLGDAYVVLAGGTGTLLELAAVWEHLNKGLLTPTRPIVVLGDCWAPVAATVEAEQPAVRPVFAQDVVDAMRILHEHL